MSADAKLQQQLASLFNKTGREHHQAFIQTDGYDQDWPRWYAGYLVDKLGPVLKASFSQSEIADLLVQAADEMKMRAPDSDWATYYARFFMERYP